MSVYPQIQKAMSYAGLLALLANLGGVVQKGDIETLDMKILAVFLFQQVVSFIVNMNYTSKINPSVWAAECTSAIIAGNVILFLIYLKVNGFGHCVKVRKCSEAENNEITLPGKHELMYLGGAVVLQVMAFNVFLA